MPLSGIYCQTAFAIAADAQVSLADAGRALAALRAAITREQVVPTVEQVKHVIALMPAESAVQRRERALIAFTLLTGARDSAVASMKLKHVNLAAGCVEQDAREVQTKFQKVFQYGGQSQRCNGAPNT